MRTLPRQTALPSRPVASPSWPVASQSRPTALQTRPVALQSCVRNITEALANELARPASSAPESSAQAWRLASAVTTTQGISPLLARSLQWQGPPGWHAFLNDQRLHTERRHARIKELLERLAEAARSAGIAVLALKGAALHELQ